MEQWSDTQKTAPAYANLLQSPDNDQKQSRNNNRCKGAIRLTLKKMNLVKFNMKTLDDYPNLAYFCIADYITGYYW
jgi:hypothetical protein